jgi:hypothetical protein
MELITEHKKAQLELALQYALQFNKVSVGDTITDYLGSIVVEEISFSSIDRCPEPLYRGRREPDDVRRSVPLTNVREIIINEA